MLAYISMSVRHPPTQLIVNLTHIMYQMKNHWTILAKADRKFYGDKLIKSEAIYSKKWNIGY